MRKALVTLSVLGLATVAYAGDGHKHGEKHWGYDGEVGPEHWGAMKEDFALCGNGKQQSPVDIGAATTTGLKPIEFHYKKSKLNVVNNGHTIQANYDAGSYAVIGGKKYDLLQFHFHSPSEHTIKGKHADMVAHLVHKSSDGELAVVGVLFDKGDENAAIKPIWDKLPKDAGGQISDAAEIDVAALLPEDRAFYNYSGSLTTPPCSEGVNWNLLKNNVTASDGQVTAFLSLFPKSIRPVQPLHGRMLSEM